MVGGGIAGLAAAHAVIEAGATGHAVRSRQPARRHDPDHSVRWASRQIDEGADAFLARVPWAVDLARKVSLGDSLTSPSIGKAAVWWNGLHDIPEGLLLGLPTSVLGLARSSLMSRRGKLRAATESAPSAHRHGSGLDRQVRAVPVRQRGARATGRSARSAASTPPTPTISASPRCRSWPRSRRVRAACCWPRDAAPRRHRDRSSTHRVARSRRSSSTRSRPRSRARGGELRSNAAVGELAARWTTDGESTASRSTASSWRVRHASRRRLLATLDAVGRRDVGGHSDRRRCAADVGDPGRRAGRTRLHGLSGYLVPKPQQRLVTAVSFGSQKWAHWASDDHVDRSGLTGPRRAAGAAPHRRRTRGRCDRRAATCTSASTCSRRPCVSVGGPKAFPQYRPHHGATIAAAERSLPGGIALAGASYHGIGIPACIRSGQLAAAADVAALILDGRLWHAAIDG